MNRDNQYIEMVHLCEQAQAMAKEAEEMLARASWIAIGLFEAGAEIPLHLIEKNFNEVKK